jgi:prepilin-type N-terminal cleavage/methylation domain-containing protein
MRNKSFTLIELLVVIAVIGLLASIIIVNLTGTRSKARIARGLQFSQSLHHALGSEAVGVWSFDEGSGTIANDASGYNNHGTLVNGPVWRCASIDPNYTPSGSGCSLQFDGVDDYVTMGDTPEMDLGFTTDVTVEAWFKHPAEDAIGWGRNIVTTIGSTPFQGYRLYLRGILDGTHYNKVHFAFGNGSTYGAQVISSQRYNDGLWHHVAAIVDRDVGLTLIVDGVDVTSKADDTTDWNNDLGGNTEVGRSNGAKSWKGYIDGVRIYKEALTSAQIQKLYAEGVKRRELVSNEY